MLEEWILQKAEAEKQRAVGERKYGDWVIVLANISLEGKGVLYGLNSHNSRLNVVLPVAGPAANTGESPAHVLGPCTWAVLREMSGEHRESIWCAMCSGNHAILCEQRAKEPCKTHSSLLSSSLRLNQLFFFLMQCLALWAIHISPSLPFSWSPIYLWICTACEWWL